MKLKRRATKRGRVEIIPMIDTIVILLIFYMSFARIAESNREASLKLPSSVAGDEFKVLPNQVIINMFSADRVTIGGEAYKLEQVPAVLAEWKQRDPDLANMSLILRGSRDMTYTDLSAFMKTCAKAGIADVTFATLEQR